MRKLMAAATLLCVAVLIAGCGDEDGGATTVIKESSDDSAEQAAERAEERVAELEEQLQNQQDSEENSQSEPAPAADPEPSGGAAPQVVGDRLDIAKQTLSSAGYRARVSGGGVFGVVVEENWVVCSQQPPDGDRVDINVARNC